MNDIDVGERDIAMVFQSYGLYPHMSVYDNMAFGLRRRKLPKAEIDARVRRTARLLNIEDYLARRPRELSGGQRQRVAVGRAIVRDPAVFLLDEPLSNLDAQLRVQMRAEILKVHRAVAATAVYVTHDQVEAMTMGDRIVLMHEGRIQQVGTPDELYDTPVNRFVASFIGTPAMGFLDCEIERRDGALHLASAHARIVLNEAQARTLERARTGRVTVGIRSEHLRLAPAPLEPAELVATGQVEVVEMLGAEQHVHFLVDGAMLAARITRDQHIEADRPVTFVAESRRIHLFDRDTGTALRVA